MTVFPWRPGPRVRAEGFDGRTREALLARAVVGSVVRPAVVGLVVRVEMPLADDAGLVPVGAEQFGEGDFLEGQVQRVEVGA